MTVSNTQSLANYNGNGSTKIFTYPFRIFLDSDLVVVLTSVAGVETTLALDVDYTVQDAGVISGGTVTLNTAPATGETLTLYRELLVTQETDYSEGDAFPAEAHEAALDRIVMIAQQYQEQLKRAVALPLASSLIGLTLPLPSPLKYLRWNVAGDALENFQLLAIEGDAEDLQAYADAGDAAVLATAEGQINGKAGLTGNETIAGVKTFSSIPVLPASAPSNDNNAVTKAWVLAQIAGLGSSTQAFKVGAIYLNVTGVNPATELGYGTWSAWGTGKMPVGYDAGQTEFNASEKTGGAKTKNLQHSHDVSVSVEVSGSLGTQSNGYQGMGEIGANSVVSASGNGSGNTDNQLSTAQDILNPYIVCYMWKRTA